MAKSKEVKQQEALARKRSQFSQKFAQLTEHRAGGKIYNERLDRWGLDKAKVMEDQANKDFGLYLREARLDSHGNELVYGQEMTHEQNESVLGDILAMAIITNGKFVNRRKLTGGEGLHDFLAQPDIDSFN